jgi:cell division protein ZapA
MKPDDALSGAQAMNNSEVEIYGSTYAIKGDAEPEYVRRLAAYVDEKMRAAAQKAPVNTPVHKIAVLAALNITDELYKARTRHQEVENMVRDKTGDLFDLLGREEPS